MYRIEIQFWSYDILEHSKDWIFHKKENAQKLFDALCKKHPEANEIVDNCYIPVRLYMNKLVVDDNEIDNILQSLQKT